MEGNGITVWNRDTKEQNFLWNFISFCSVLLLLMMSCSSASVIKGRKTGEIQFKQINYLKIGKVIKKTAVYNGRNVMVAIADIAGNISIYSLPGLVLKKRIFSGPAAVIGMAFHNNGEKLTIAYASGEIVTSSVAGSSSQAILMRKGKFGQLRSLAAHLSKDRIILGNDKGEILLFNKMEQEPIRKQTGLKSIYHLKFSPDGKRIALAGGRAIVTLGTDGMTEIKKRKIRSPAVSFAFSADSEYLAAGTLFFRVLLLKSEALALKGSFEISMDPVSCLAFLRSKQWLIAGSGKTGKGTLHIFRYPEMKLKKKEKLDMEEIIHIESLPDGIILTISSDGTIQLLQLND